LLKLTTPEKEISILDIKSIHIKSTETHYVNQIVYIYLIFIECITIARA